MRNDPHLLDDSVLLPADPFPTSVPRVGLLQAARRHWPLVVIPTVLLLVAGLLLAQARQPTYTAVSRVAVGGLKLDQPGALSGFSTAAATLASGYARAVNGDAVINPIAAKLHETPQSVSGHLSATPVADSPVIKIQATGSSAANAEALANDAARQLTSNVAAQRPTDPDTPRLFRQLQAATLRQQQYAIIASKTADANTNNDTPDTRQALAMAKSQLETSNAQVSALQSAYQAAASGQSATATLQPLNQAISASSNRATNYQIYGFVGLVAGLIIGLALAVLASQRQLRRWLATS
jgi:uncharacterized protein involved in exopolysaccharide biosynthesis